MAAPATPATVAVAFSGGRDSLALLHAACRSAAALGLRVVAIHVHHGLLPEADGWLRRAQRLVGRWHRRGWPVALRWARLDGRPAAGQSIEAWAHSGRHAALDRMAREAGATLLLLAHHRRDQAETVVLQLLRGGGPAGLAAMPRSAERDGLVWARPWLDCPREAIDAYVRCHRLRPVDDPSNGDDSLARNRLRRRLWPALLAAFGDAEAALAAAARRAHEADAALAELAAIDLSGCTDDHGRLQLAGWRRLSAARQANAMRAWWRQRTGRGMTAALLRRLLQELPGGERRRDRAAAGRWPAGGDFEVALYRGLLSAVESSASRAGLPSPPGELVVDLSVPGCWAVIDWAGCFEVSDCDCAGLPATALQAVALRPRCGGERFQSRPGTVPRSLKKQYQAAGLPAAARGGPLVWAGASLLFAPGLGADARAWAPPDVPQRCLRWCAGGSPAAPQQIK